MTMQVLRCVLEQPVSAIVILDVEHGNALEPAPPQRDNQWVSCLQDPLVPSVLLQSEL